MLQSAKTKFAKAAREMTPYLVVDMICKRDDRRAIVVHFDEVPLRANHQPPPFR
jgi:hypothetical protein